MHWFKNNVVGLIGISLIVGSSLVTLYIKAEVNAGAIAQVKESIKIMAETQSTQNISLQSNLIRTAQMEIQMSRFAKSNDRLITALDKLDTLYGSVTVSNAIQDEKLRSLSSRVESGAMQHYQESENKNGS